MNTVISPNTEPPEAHRQETTIPGDEGMGIYVHVPFCRRKCLYCDFASVPLNSDAQIDAWREAILREIEWVRRQDICLSPVTTMYWGGGTPSLLPISSIDRIVDALHDAFDFSRCTEWTIEVNPESLESEWADEMRTRGLDRVSCGVQSLDDDLLQFLGRPHDAAQARRALAVLRAGPPLRWSADLMCGIPGQTIQRLIEDIEEITAAAPSHLSLYPLTIEENTPLAGKSYRKKIRGIDDELVADMLVAAEEFLRRRGYIHYEIANYCLAGEACRHNLGYWRRAPYLGLGPSAASFINNTRSVNHHDVQTYIEAWNDKPRLSDIDPFQRPATDSGEYIDEQAACREEIMLGTRLLDDFDLTVWRKRWSKANTDPLESIIADHVSRGTLLRHGQLIRLSTAGRWIANSFWRDIVVPESE